MSVDLSLIAKAAKLLHQGELVALPTETVYGLGADATSRAALAKLYALKGRPNGHPVIVHLHAMSQVEDWACELPEAFYVLAEKFWPGPLTMIVRRVPSVLDEVTGGQTTIGLRMPSHPVAVALLKEFGKGVAAPSANKFGRLSPTTVRAVREEFGQELSMVLDGGPCAVGIESTIVDLSEGAKILRPGMILSREIFDALHIAQTEIDAEIAPEVGEETPRVPGSLPSHYAPETPMDLVPSHLLKETVASYGNPQSLAAITFSALSGNDLCPNNLIVAELDAALYARSIYANLRRLDGLHQSLIIVEEPPQTPEWSGIRDRLLRASCRI